ncbi:dUTPase [Clostridium botulinum]|nr:dUTP diphosphatase [Clostridium botulinum]MBN3354046.1 dUTPase [Clostridium botulinum]QDY29446.1 dUTPase [Clostridium botulinum]
MLKGVGEIVNLRELLKKQKELDGIILERAGIKKYPYESMKLALLVELGELANEVQSFKHWKQHKEINREKVLEEFSDCLHFALSLENQLNQFPDEFLDNFSISISIYKRSNKEINQGFLQVYKFVLQGYSILLSVIGLGLRLGITLEEMEQSYLEKYETNIKRQQEGY